jgi:hypothetical protein
VQEPGNEHVQRQALPYHPGCLTVAAVAPLSVLLLGMLWRLVLLLLGLFTVAAVASLTVLPLLLRMLLVC